MQATNDALVGLVVVNRQKGIGVVSELDEGRAVIQVGHSDIISPETVVVQTPRLADRLILQHLSDAESMTWKIPVDDFLDQSDWSVAPSERRMELIMEAIRSTSSNIVIPTTNPGRASMQKERIMESHYRFLEQNTISYDENFINILYQITTIVDTQISWYLLKGSEGYHQYQDRVEELMDHLLLDAWSNCIISEVPGASRDRIIECLGAVASVQAFRTGISICDAVRDTVTVVEQRIEMYRPLISEFLRNRKGSARRPSVA